MKRIVHPTTPVQTPKVVDPVNLGELSIDKLITDGLLILHREVKNLLFASAKGKLNPPEARDLRDTVKLLFELKDRESELLAAMDKEDVEKKASE